MSIDINTIVGIIEKFGITTTMLIWVIYWTTVFGKESIERIDNLNMIINKWANSTNRSINNLIRQNNFMLHAFSNLIMGHKEAARDMVRQAIVEAEDLMNDIKDGDKS